MSLTVDSKVAVMSDDEISGESSSLELGDVCSPGSELLSPGELGRIMGRVRDQNLRLVADGGVVNLLSKKILERALEEEPTVHAGYERGDPAGRGSANSRNSVYPLCGWPPMQARSTWMFPETGPPRSSRGSSVPVLPAWQASATMIVAWYTNGHVDPRHPPADPPDVGC